MFVWAIFNFAPRKIESRGSWIYAMQRVIAFDSLEVAARPQHILMSIDKYIEDNNEYIARYVHTGAAFTIHYWTRRMLQYDSPFVPPRDIISGEVRLYNGVYVLESLRETLERARVCGGVLAVVGFDNRCLANEIIILAPELLDACNVASPALFVFPAH